MARSVDVALRLITKKFRDEASDATDEVEQLEDALRRAAKRGVDELEAKTLAASKALETYSRALDENADRAEAARRASAAAADAVDEMQRSSSGASGGIQNFLTGLGEMHRGAMAIVDGFEVAAESVNRLLEAGERAAQANRTERYFQNVAGGAQIAERYLNAMQEATRYTVSETESMQQAIKLLGLELVDTPQQLAQVAQQATILGREFGGLDAEQSIERFVDAISDMSTDALKELGVSASDVEIRMAQLEAQGIATDEAFKQATLEQMSSQFDRLGGATTDSATTFEQMRAAIENLKDSVGDSQWIVALAGAIRDVANALSGASQDRAIDSLANQLSETTGNTEAYLSTLEEYGEKTLDPGRLLQGSMGPDALSDYAETVRETATTWEEYSRGLELVNKQIEIYNAARSYPGRGGAASQMETFDISQTDFQAAQQQQAEFTQQIQAANDTRVQDAQQTAAELESVEASLAANRARIAEQSASARQQAEQRAADAAIQWARRAEDAAIAAQRRRADMARRIGRQRQQIAERYAQAIAQAESNYQSAIESAEESHGDRLVDIERDFRRRMADIQRSYEQSMQDAIINRDAAALIRARRTRDEQVEEARQTRQEQRQQADEQYRDQLDAAREALQQQRQAAEQARQQATENLQQQIQEQLETQRIAEQRRIEDENRARARQEEDRQRWLNRRLQQIRQANQAELQEMQRHYAALLAMSRSMRAYSGRLSGMANAYARGRGSSVPTYADGGYAVGGLSMLHAGEFVLNPESVRAMEARVGGQLTQQNITRGGVNISIAPPQFNGVAGQDRGWIQSELSRFQENLYREIARNLQ